jgi:hypothetical protein
VLEILSAPAVAPLFRLRRVFRVGCASDPIPPNVFDAFTVASIICHHSLLIFYISKQRKRGISSFYQEIRAMTKKVVSFCWKCSMRGAKWQEVKYVDRAIQRSFAEHSALCSAKDL